MSATLPKLTLISPPWYPVPPIGYGGIELVVYLLARELRRRGQQVDVLSVSESGLQEAVGLAPGHYSNHLGGRDERWYDLAYASRVLRWLTTAQSHPRIIHDHTGGVVLAALASGPLRLPVLHTVHGTVGAGEAEFYRQVQSGSGLVAISHAQARTAPDLKWAGVVENAVDVDHLLPATAKDRDDYLLVLARITPEKGQHLAIEVAARVGLPLVLAGKVAETDVGERYYREQIVPHLDGQKVTYIPNVSGWEKARLLSRALALLAPSQWEEPFGLAMAEALASGTPVVAFPRGAAVDLIQDGVNGLLCPDLDSMVARLGSVRDLVPELIAATARERFSPARMADGYQALYRSALAGTALSLWSEVVPSGWSLDHFQVHSAETDIGLRAPVPSPVGFDGDPTRS